jgi:hypothetical protein
MTIDIHIAPLLVGDASGSMTARWGLHLGIRIAGGPALERECAFSAHWDVPRDEPLADRWFARLNRS